MNGPLMGTFRVSQRYKGTSHKGIDLVGITSKKIHATVNGVVEAARWDMKWGSGVIDTNYGMGKYVRIKGDDAGYLYYFAHMSQLLVSAGQKIRKGDVIGIEGSTGNSTGSHVHYEIRRTTSNTTFLNVSELSDIPNKLGIYVQEDTSMDSALKEARSIVQKNAGLENITMDYLEAYQYGKELILKLAASMR